MWTAWWSDAPSWLAFSFWLPDPAMDLPDAFPPLLLRPFASRAEYEACTAFQEEVWGEGFSERVSAAILMVANKIGGLSAGAFDEEGRLQGFVFGMTGVREGELVHWSDMLAVRSHLRDRGLGTRLKHYQREVLLARGIAVMHWTFDPLQSRNAHVNFRKLGIVAREYVPDMYGNTGSPLHGGLGTDRLVATWEMDSPRVQERLMGGEALPSVGSLEGMAWALREEGGGRFPRPGVPDSGLDSPEVCVSIPRDADGIMAGDPALAFHWREATREAFQGYLERGYEVRELIPDRELSHYLLVRVRDSGDVAETSWEGSAG